MNCCKTCKNFIQGDGHQGVCSKKPYVSTRRGAIQTIQGEPRKLVVYWAKKACKLYEQAENNP